MLHMRREDTGVHWNAADACILTASAAASAALEIAVAASNEQNVPAGLRWGGKAAAALAATAFHRHPDHATAFSLLPLQLLPQLPLLLLQRASRQPGKLNRQSIPHAVADTAALDDRIGAAAPAVAAVVPTRSSQADCSSADAAPAAAELLSCLAQTQMTLQSLLQLLRM